MPTEGRLAVIVKCEGGLACAARELFALDLVRQAREVTLSVRRQTDEVPAKHNRVVVHLEADDTHAATAFRRSDDDSAKLA
jgi:hypothetical protein